MNLSLNVKHKDDIRESNKMKKYIILRKMKSRSPDAINKNDILTEPTILLPVAIKAIDCKPKLPDFIEKIQKIQLNEFITLKKVKTTINKGVVKRMLHVPSFKTYDIIVISLIMP